MSREGRRFRRQIDVVAGLVPGARRIIESFVSGPLRWVRLPAGLALVAGGLLSFLPVLGLWMLPFGLVLLAIDLPALRPWVSAAMIRLRRRLRRLTAGDGALGAALQRLGIARGRRAAAPHPGPPAPPPA